MPRPGGNPDLDKVRKPAPLGNQYAKGKAIGKAYKVFLPDELVQSVLAASSESSREKPRVSTAVREILERYIHE